jgi:hypothetical protein
MSNVTPKVAGIIGYYGLSEWWFNTFTEDERNYINYRVRTMRAGPNALIEGTPFIITNSTHNNVSSFLINLTFWFRTPKDNSIARRIALKAFELAEDIDDIGWSLAWIIRLHYYARNQVPDALERVISACKQYIEIAPLLAEKHKKQYPRLNLGKHEGFNRYTILLEKNRNYSEAIQLCEEAKRQGWKGDWNKRIERCTKRLSKMDGKNL